VLLHGGFWLDRYGLDLMDPLAADLRDRGWATWNVEYRRLGSGGGFPETFADVAAAYDAVPTLGLEAALPTAAVGHSAGGHLAVWAASRRAETPGGRARWTPGTTISLSGVLCLAAADRDGLGNGAATELVGTRFDGTPSVYDLADPVRLTPPAGRVVAVHAADDRQVPASQSSDYVAAASARGGAAELVEVPGDHFDLIDPGSEAWARAVELLP
jgi:acetyl esterase/lipase